MNMKIGKIFGIGSPKTGTSSLGESFNLLGFKHKTWDESLWEKYENGDYETIFHIAEKYESFEDGPWNGPDLYYQKGPAFYKMLDQRFPNSKFILTIRDSDSWIKSHELHFSSEGLKKIPEKYWIYNYNRTEMVACYEKRNKEIIEYFKDRPRDLLIMDICEGDGWEILCPFLGVDIQNVLFPHVNKTTKRNMKSSKVNAFIKQLFTNG